MFRKIRAFVFITICVLFMLVVTNLSDDNNVEVNNEN